MYPVQDIVFHRLGPQKGKANAGIIQEAKFMGSELRALLLKTVEACLCLCQESWGPILLLEKLSLFWVWQGGPQSQRLPFPKRLQPDKKQKAHGRVFLYIESSIKIRGDMYP